ncbi:MAG: acyl-ACP--UDP-N-acetylglucosamine O-acyltransferase [Candidatus Omnitrophota bacterium]|nr:acyl-ACP--UDP-N-acetylglucosamine O-acyltransferase [Candidatus Omnitrophota bacterium]
MNNNNRGEIHKTAIVSKKAKLADDVLVGPYTLIGDDVIINSSVKIGSHCVFEGFTSIGKGCEIFTGSVLGSRPQDLKYKGEKSYLEIGDNNIIREYCTFNPGTGEGNKTIIGSNNLFMAYSHIAHDCVVGNNCVIANNGTLAGHVTIEDGVVVGGLAAIHQFVRIGLLAIIGGCSKVVQDIPPYSTCDGHPAVLYGLNLIGLRRSNIPGDSIKQLNYAFKALFNSGVTLKHGLEKIEKEITLTPEVSYLLDFVKKSQRGIAHSCRK